MITETHNSKDEPLADAPNAEERRALIERVAASEHFSRSARLRDFLLYVGNQSLRSGRPEINELEIGIKVFGRPATYDRSQDNIVRVNASELRKRIELYFASEGAEETLILEIPRGGYKPVFHRRQPGAKEAVAPLSAEIPPSNSALDAIEVEAKQTSPRIRLHLAWGIACLLLVVACAVLARQNRTLQNTLNPWEGKPALKEFWTGFLNSSQQTDLVLPDTSVSLSVAISRHPITLSEYLDHSYESSVRNSNFSEDRRADLAEVFRHNLITFGDVHAAQQILALNPLSSSMHLNVARFYTADSIKRDNVILIGGKEANPWVFLLDGPLNFSLEQDSNLHLFIANRHPQAGEQATYSGNADRNVLLGYCVISYVPNPSRNGKALVIAGTDSDATSAAAEFLTSEEQMEKLRNLFHANQFPSFEVLLKTSRLSGTAFNAELIAYRSDPAIR